MTGTRTRRSRGSWWPPSSCSPPSSPPVSLASLAAPSQPRTSRTAKARSSPGLQHAVRRRSTEQCNDATLPVSQQAQDASSPRRKAMQRDDAEAGSRRGPGDASPQRAVQAYAVHGLAGRRALLGAASSIDGVLRSASSSWARSPRPTQSSPAQADERRVSAAVVGGPGRYDRRRLGQPQKPGGRRSMNAQRDQAQARPERGAGVSSHEQLHEDRQDCRRRGRGPSEAALEQAQSGTRPTGRDAVTTPPPSGGGDGGGGYVPDPVNGSAAATAVVRGACPCSAPPSTSSATGRPRRRLRLLRPHLLGVGAGRRLPPALGRGASTPRSPTCRSDQRPARRHHRTYGNSPARHVALYIGGGQHRPRHVTPDPAARSSTDSMYGYDRPWAAMRPG